MSLNRGSSPLTRGTPTEWHEGLRKHRFIPAYAGNSDYQKQAREYDPVHPRLRGELAD